MQFFLLPLLLADHIGILETNAVRFFNFTCKIRVSNGYLILRSICTNQIHFIPMCLKEGDIMWHKDDALMDCRFQL